MWFGTDYGREVEECEKCVYFEWISTPYCNYFAETLDDCPCNCDVCKTEL